jgi:hypothetical protein
LFKIIDAMNPVASKLWIDAPEDIREFDVDLSKKNLECTSHRLPPGPCSRESASAIRLVPIALLKSS